MDTGASDTVIPSGVLERLGVPVLDRWPFELADDRIVDHDIGQISVRIDGTSRIAAAVFSQSDTTAFLGASTLEVFHLAADRVNKRLIPAHGRLMRSTGSPLVDWP